MCRIRDPSHGELDDGALLAASLGGGDAGRRAFEAIVRRHEGWLVRLTTYILGSQAEAEEVTQEVFLRAYRARGTFRGEATVRGWLRVIATRLAYNHRSSARARQRREYRVGELATTSTPDPRSRYEADDALVKVLAELSYPYREILLLRHLEELSLQEIAEVLDIGLSAAKMRLGRARVAFLERFKEKTDG
ncbi:MAG: hypothetical protein CVU56_20840 [Deltaproteobacteria bacterium HGW-Deltaproteobacteria-14]|nr:MAG: hypothetical protein CVU56_20840 [Deltaproteobacteria bacterium HGW-Deltaproteobacteria-14]